MKSAGSAPGRVRAALERAFEVTSVLPLAAFAVLHLGNYARVLFGATEIGSRHARSGGVLAAEALFIWLPLGFHLALAGPVWRERRLREVAAVRSAAWLALHLLTGAILACFVVDHFVRFSWPIIVGDRYPADSMLVLARELSSTFHGVPLLAAWHALGTLALAYHLSYGLARVAERHVSPARARLLRAGCVALGTLAALFGTLTIVRLAAG